MTASPPPLVVRPCADGDRDALVALWGACGLLVPWNDPLADIALARSKPNAALLVGLEAGEDPPVASVMAGHDGHRGWLYYLAVDPARRGRGHGRTMVAAAEAWLAGAGMPKAQLMVRETNQTAMAFYARLGYAPSPVTVMQKWLKTDSP